MSQIRRTNGDSFRDCISFSNQARANRHSDEPVNDRAGACGNSANCVTGKPCGLRVICEQAISKGYVMKQVLQQATTGDIAVLDVPAPKLLPGCVLVKMAVSLVSAGTERAACEFASKNLLQKARARPDLVREIFNKIRRDGIFSAVAAVRSRLDQPNALGYSSSGRVIEVGVGITDLNVGDRVACAGASYAVHAEFACIPRLLVARIRPDSAVSFEEAAFTTLGAVALHGVRTAEVKLGDVVAVIGLGLLGQLTVQILKAAGCRVLGMDIAAERAELALRLGADDVSISRNDLRDLCLQHSGGHGADAVLITAETASSEPVDLAGEVARDRGVVVAVGTVGMDIQRRRYFEKELDFRISRSYGPGRYDMAYEQKGRDYPVGYVRWTETRNMEAFLRFLSEGKIYVKPLITHRFSIERAQGAYDLITGRVGQPFLGVLITYPEQDEAIREIQLIGKGTAPSGVRRQSGGDWSFRCWQLCYEYAAAFDQEASRSGTGWSVRGYWLACPTCSRKVWLPVLCH